MWRQKLCIALGPQFEIELAEQQELIKKIGYDGFFVEWYEGMDVQALKKKSDELGLLFQSIHAPYYKAAKMWKKGEDAENAVEELTKCVYACAENQVPIMVCHAFIGFDEHSPNEYGVENYGIVIEEARKNGVKIAFENTEGEEYLKCLMDAFSDRENVGFCWDTGHEMCYNHSKDMMELYGDRIQCTHLNDNLGIRDYEGNITFIDDLHLLPFDGIADWEDIVCRLNKHGFNDVLTFELNLNSKPGRYDNNIYKKLTLEEYLTESYKRACRIAVLKMKNIVK